jgi:hypothetical protein
MTPGRDQVVTGQGLPRRPEGVQGVALGAGAARRPLGPPDLDHPLAAGLQEGGQPSAVAAGALHRPAAPSRHLRLAERKQALVAGEVGRRRGLRQRAADAIGGSGGQGVPVGVHPDHPSTVSASLDIMIVSLPTDAWSCRPRHRAALL